MERKQFLWLMKLLSAGHTVPILDSYILKDGVPLGLFSFSNSNKYSLSGENSDLLEVLSQIYRECLLLQRLGMGFESPCFFFIQNKRMQIHFNELELILTNGIVPSDLTLIQLGKPDLHSEFVFSLDSEKKTPIMKKAHAIVKNLVEIINKETNKLVTSLEVLFVADKQHLWIADLRKIAFSSPNTPVKEKKTVRRTLSHKFVHKQIPNKTRKNTADSLSRMNSGVISSRLKRKHENGTLTQTFMGPAIAAKKLITTQRDKFVKIGRPFNH